MANEQQMHDTAVTRFNAVIHDLLREAVPPLIIGDGAAQALLTMFAEFQSIDHTDQWVMNVQQTVDSYYRHEGRQKEIPDQ